MSSWAISYERLADLKVPKASKTTKNEESKAKSILFGMFVSFEHSAYPVWRYLTQQIFHKHAFQRCEGSKTPWSQVLDLINLQWT